MWDYWGWRYGRLNNVVNLLFCEKVIDKGQRGCYNSSQSLMKPNYHIKQPVSNAGFKRGQSRR